MAPLPVQSRFGPTLPEILGRRRWRLLAGGVVTVAVVAGAVALIDGGGPHYTRHQHPTFNFDRDAALRQVGPRDGEYVRFEQRARGRLVRSFAVAPLAIPPYDPDRQDVAGTLPILAGDVMAAERRRWPGLSIVGEGRARVHEAPAYAVFFDARTPGPRPRPIFGRMTLLPPPEAGDHQGVTLELISARAGQVTRAGLVGTPADPLSAELNSFVFGTDEP